MAAAPAYGYQPQRFGYGFQTPQQGGPRSLALAAAGRTVAPPPESVVGNAANGGQYATPIAAASAPSPAPSTPPPSTPAIQQTYTGAPPVGTVFDINTAPEVQAENALLAQNDAEATAGALSQKQQVALAYGDRNLAAKLFGANDPFVQAAAQNPNSTVKQLARGYDQGVHDLTENLNKQNLSYGGYRITQEQKAAQDYQNQLANAAAQVNGTLGGINSTLAQALAASRSQRIQVLQQAYQNHKSDPGVTTGVSTTLPNGWDPFSPAPGTPPSTPPPALRSGRFI